MNVQCGMFSKSSQKALHQVRIIGGTWKRTPLPVLDLEGLRPTPNRVRETLFNWLGQRLDGSTCLDLFAGSGALGFEAASRGAKRVLMVERNPRAVQQLRLNQEKLAAQAIDIVQADALQLAAKLAPASFDIAFVDPPFKANFLPQALLLSQVLIRPGGVLYFEAPVPFDELSLLNPLEPGAQRNPFEDWHIAHHKQAGVVHYHLLRRI